MQAKRLKIRLFLEGIEVPVVSVAVSSAPDTPLEVSMQIPATDDAIRLIERTMFHVFYYDPQPEDKLAGDEYKLFCMGEIVGFQFAKSEHSRAVVLTGMDFSVHWDTTYLFNATGLGKEGRKLASFVGANTSVVSGSAGIFPDSGSTGFSKLAKIINGKPASFPKMKGLMAGIVHLLEKVGGFYRGERVYKGFNDYTSLAELRIKLMQQIHAAEGDNTSALLFKRKVLERWVKNTIAERGSMETFNGISKKLMSLIFHRRQSIPAPPYFPGKETKRRKTYYTTKGLSGAKLAAELKAFIAKMEDTDINTNNYYITLSRAARSYYRFAKACEDYSTRSAKSGAPEQGSKFVEAARYLALAGSKSDGYKTELARSLTTISGGRFSTIGSDILGEPLAFARRAYNLLMGLRTTAVKKSRTAVDYEYERVGMHVFKPDIFFTAPPRCNVLFPDQYSEFSWSRNYLAEPTRLMIRGGGERGDMFGSGFSKYGVYFAPDIPSVRGSVKLSSEKFAKQILEHELYSGIIPAQLQIPWAKIYKIAVHGAAKKYPYMQRLANFEYAKQHYASRTGTITGRFNPGFLPGFPALVIDKPLTKSQLAQYNKPLADAVKGLQLADSGDVKTKADLLDAVVSPQYLVFPQSVSHVVSQEGGITTYNIAMVRDHKETTDKLGISTMDVYTKTFGRNTSVLALVFGGWSSKDYRIGPHGGKIVRAVKLKDDPKPGYSYWIPTRATGTQSDSGRPVSAGWVRAMWYAGFEPIIAVPRIFRTEAAVYRLTEQLAITGKKVIKKDLGPEFAITPPWMARIWHVAEVSNTYEQMFGTTSIMDDVGLVVDDELATAWRQEQQARIEKQLPPTSVDPYVAVDNEDPESYAY